MTERTEAERQSDYRRDKAVWINAELKKRLPGADFTQPGITPKPAPKVAKAKAANE